MEATKTKMNIDGTFRAKVLQYKSDGNTLTEKWHTLTKFAEGIYLSYAAPDKYEQVYVTVVFAKNGVFWKVGCEPEQCFRPDSFHYAEHVETLKKRYANYEAGIMQAVANGGWLNKLHITVMERLGYDTTAMIEAYNEVRRQREERDRQQAEKAERRERERMKAEERRKAEVLEDGKEKLLNHERITVEQIELIAETVGYKINIRTIGFMREKVTEVVMLDNDRVQVFGYKLTSRNIDGTAKVMHELYDQLKVQAEEETKQAATLTETPQISTEIAETVNVSAESEKAAETEQIGRMPEGREAKCRLAPKWAANIALKYGYTLLCFNLYPNGEFTISVENKNGCRILTKDEFRKLCSQPPQSPETPQAAECIADTPKPQEMARKEPRRTISKKERVYYPAWRDKFARYHFAHVNKMVPTLILAPPGYAPPIRGDCEVYW